MRIAGLIFFLITRITLAAEKSILEGDSSCITAEKIREGNISFDKIPCIILNVTNNLLSFVGYISLGVMLIGALMYVFGGVNEEFKSKGKEAIKLALIGAIISWSSWLIINFILDNI